MATTTPEPTARPRAIGPALLRVLLADAWVYVLMAGICSEEPRYADAVLATFTFTVCFWIAHVAHAPVRSAETFGRVLGRVLRELLLMLLVVFAFLVPVGLLMPAYQCYGPRARLSEALNYSAATKLAVTEAILRSGTISGSGRGLEVVPAGRVAGGFVDPDGMIVIVSDDPPAVLLLTPTFANGDVVWHCFGVPTGIVPASCRRRE